VSGEVGFYGPSTVRRRRTNDELALLDEAVIRAVAEDKPVTLRGVFYRAMSAGAVPKTELGYRSVGRRLVELRRRGRVSYWDITDGTRWVTKPRTFDGWREALEASAQSYRKALWTSSECSLQLFTEKDAISGVILPITDRWDVTLGVLRGYSSESFAWPLGQSMDPWRTNVLAQLGDHDPSGVGAWRDFCRKVREFAPDAHVECIRLAVTPEQINEWNLPQRPTKMHDSRARDWIGGSVEVDAIPAPTLRAIVETWIESYIDTHEIATLRAIEAQERATLRSFLQQTGHNTHELTAP